MEGIGIDIVSTRHIKEIITQDGQSFLNKVFTDAERRLGESSERGLDFYAGNFAAKEAVFKLFRRSWQCDESFKDIEILRGVCGEPVVNLYGGFAGQAGPGKQVTVSISYMDGAAIAAAILNEKASSIG